MKRILLLILGYWLGFQSFMAVLNTCGAPEHAAPLLLVAGFSGWGAHAIIRKARAMKPTVTVYSRQQLPIENAPTKELPVPDTQPLERK